jgi:hypothetical protein
MAYPIATELSYAVLKRIQRERQLGLDQRDSAYARVQVVSGYNPRLFVADPDFGQPEDGDGAHVGAVYADSNIGPRK